MKRLRGDGMLKNTVTTGLLAFVAFLFATGHLHAQTQTPAAGQDFFTNVILTEARTDGSDGQPGFNPCGTGGTLNGAGTHCTTGTDGLLSGDNVINRGAGLNGIFGDSDDTLALGLFTKLGPGAVTDNMFGKVLKPDFPGRCGPDGSIGTDTVGNPPVTATDPSGSGELNCGNIRFDPTTQGQIIPTQGNILSGVMSSNTPIDLPFTAGGSVIPEQEHTSKMVNAFVWNPLTTAVTLSPGRLCAAREGHARVCGFQSLEESTNLGQVGRMSTVSTSASWTTGQNETINPSGALQSSMTSQPVVTWSASIIQDELGGTGGQFEQSTTGSFNYDAGLFPSADHPTGLSFTNGQIGVQSPGP